MAHTEKQQHTHLFRRQPHDRRPPPRPVRGSRAVSRNRFNRVQLHGPGPLNCQKPKSSGAVTSARTPGSYMHKRKLHPSAVPHSTHRRFPKNDKSLCAAGALPFSRPPQSPLQLDPKELSTGRDHAHLPKPSAPQAGTGSRHCVPPACARSLPGCVVPRRWSWSGANAEPALNASAANHPPGPPTRQNPELVAMQTQRETL